LSRRDEERQNREQAAKEARTRQIESRTPFLELQLKLYVAIAEISGKLSSLDVTSAAWREAATRFWGLYWSELCMVESKNVEKIMVRLGEAVEACEKTGDNGLKANIKDWSIKLARRVRKEIDTAWTSAPVPPN
jgi:hypothetical protein